MSPELKSCPFCGVSLVGNDNQADLYVRRYGTHYAHPFSTCHLSDHEVTPSEIENWNRRAAQAPQAAKPVAWRYAGSLFHDYDAAIFNVGRKAA